MTDDDKALRLALADRLAADGHLRTAPWRSAVETVARHEFLRSGFFERADGPGPTAWRPVMPDDPRWLQRCYDDESLVTQIAGTMVPRDIRGEIMRSPTSSRTLPSLVVRMLEDLQVTDGHRVLEIGTGYSTGLLCARLGEDLVTSKEVDPEVAASAAVALGACGYFPELVVGDGLSGHPGSAPYDRTIATCAVRELPYAWVEQTKPGGLILATLCGWMHASELARLTVGKDGTARGRFLGGRVSFMLARPHLPPDLGTLPDLDAAYEQPTEIGADVLDDWTTRFVAQLAAPRAQRVSLEHDGRTEHVVLDVDAGAWAALAQDERGTWAVRQGGPARLWDDVAEHITRWRGDGAPGLDRFEVTVAPEGQSVSWSKA